MANKYQQPTTTDDNMTLLKNPWRTRAERDMERERHHDHRGSHNPRKRDAERTVVSGRKDSRPKRLRVEADRLRDLMREDF